MLNKVIINKLNEMQINGINVDVYLATNWIYEEEKVSIGLN